MVLSDGHRLLRNVDVATLVDCGCNVYVWKDGSGAEVKYCPLHRSAQELFDAGNLALTELDRIGSDIGFEPDRYRERIAALDALSRAIRNVRDKNAR